MNNTPSLLSIFASLIYLPVAASAILAASAGRRKGRPQGEATTWLALAALFIVLAVSRWFAWEADFHAAMKQAAKARGIYGLRREVQAPLAFGALLAAGALSLFMILRVRAARGAARLCTIATLGGGVMISLIALRLLSFHWLDRLLYSGVRLNWIVDIGSALGVAACAAAYWRSLADKRRRRRA